MKVKISSLFFPIITLVIAHILNNLIIFIILIFLYNYLLSFSKRIMYAFGEKID